MTVGVSRHSILFHHRIRTRKNLHDRAKTTTASSTNAHKNPPATMSPREREPIPYNDSFNSVEDVKQLPQKKSVTFGMIHRREFNRIVGDHPDVKVGPPISLDWGYGELPSLPLDVYESNRAPFKPFLRMSSITRKNILRNVFEVDEEEIRSAEKEVQRIRQGREKSAKQSESVAVVESAVLRAGRKLRKGFIRSLSASGKMFAAGSMPMSVHAY
jgi:hypothetical protein